MKSPAENLVFCRVRKSSAPEEFKVCELIFLLPIWYVGHNDDDDTEPTS
jgi:hypothetical protein